MGSVTAPIFGFNAVQDFKNSSAVIAQVVQGGLGLPDRDYYTKDDDKSKQTRDEYVKHIARTFVLLGDDADRAAAEAKTVMNIETKLAENSVTRVQRRVVVVDEHEHFAAEARVLRRCRRCCGAARRRGPPRARFVGGVEVGDLLRASVFEDLEIIASEAVDRRPFGRDGDVDVHDANVDRFSNLCVYGGGEEQRETDGGGFHQMNRSSETVEN